MSNKIQDTKLIKTVIIARSGIYFYRAEELRALKLNIADAPERKERYAVYRPAIVLENDKAKFSMMTLTNNHPGENVEGNNFKQYAIGFTGENVEAEWNEESGEVVLKTKVALVDNQAINNYMVGIDEVSPGYYANFKWEKGKSPKGEEYDIIMTEVELSNHLAMTPKARGGKVACIVDSQGGYEVTITRYASSLIRQIKRFLSGVKDSDAGQFRLICDELASQKEMKEDEKTKKIDELKKMVTDLPESDDKSMLSRYIEDLNTLDLQTPEVAKAAADKVATLYEKLDTESMKEGETMSDITEQANVKDAVSLEYIQAELTKLGQGMLNLAQTIGGGGSSAPTAPAADNNAAPTAPATPVANAPAAPQKPPAQDSSNGMQPSELVPKTEPPKAQDAEPTVAPPSSDPKKQPVADSMGYQNITMDSATDGKNGFMDFFNTKVKGGRK